MMLIIRSSFICASLWLSSPLLAGTMGEDPIVLWKGSYIGGYLGGAFGSTQITTQTAALSTTTYFSTAANGTAVNQSGTYSTNPNGFIIGVQGGENWVWRNWVFGAAIDYGSFPQQTTRSTTANFPDATGIYTVQTSFNTNWLFTLRGRIGTPIEYKWPTLIYVTGGMAMANLTVTNNFSDTSSLLGAGQSSISDNQIGWTVGAGIDLAMTQDLSFNAEYLYVSLPSLTTSGNIANTASGFGIAANEFSSSFATTASVASNLFRIGFHYRFPIIS